MELFVDSADIKIIKGINGLRIFNGITTTPTFFMRQGVYDYEKELQRITEIIDGEVHVEAMGDCVEEIIENAEKNSAICNRIVSKIPMSKNAIEAVKILSEKGIRTNVHLVFSLNQAILAAKAGADYICPLIGRMTDIGINAFDILKDIISVMKINGFRSKVMASSIRNPEDVRKSLLLNVDAVTIPPGIIEKMISHPLTNIGISIFEKDITMTKKVNDLMKDKSKMPIINENDYLYEVLNMMTDKKIGIAIAVNEKEELKGIVTDGDIRRHLKKDNGFFTKKISECMNIMPKTIEGKYAASDALKKMKENRITSLIVTQERNKPVGYINIHDIIGNNGKQYVY